MNPDDDIGAWLRANEGRVFLRRAGDHVQVQWHAGSGRHRLEPVWLLEPVEPPADDDGLDPADPTGPGEETW